MTKPKKEKWDGKLRPFWCRCGREIITFPEHVAAAEAAFVRGVEDGVDPGEHRLPNGRYQWALAHATFSCDACDSEYVIWWIPDKHPIVEPMTAEIRKQLFGDQTGGG